MLDQVILALSHKLDDLFGEEYHCYAEDVPQDFQTPCFEIRDLGVTPRQFLRSRKLLGQPFDILYFPGSEKAPRAEIRAVQAVLLDQLEYITLEDGSLLRGTGMRCETVDNVGHFLVDYNVMVRKPMPDPTLMEELDTIPQTKGKDGDIDGG